MQSGRLGKISMWGFHWIYHNYEVVDNWIHVIWKTQDKHNISEHIKIQYKLRNVIFEPKDGTIVLKCVCIFRLSKSLQDYHTLNVCSRSTQFGQKLRKVVLIRTQSKKCATTWRLVTIVTWLIQSYPYPQCSRFSRLTDCGHVTPWTSFSALIWVDLCIFLGNTDILTYTTNF